ncbi:hypothetical protein WA1_18620 [Scytonema hofmannii PCC 7110]|uniref:Uncharacterized protein n=1 Tax=Scytonema hofmannii PCC 7110 TaxID=128403 RepID=A0A139XBF4_9CYAN|nr:helix-turn-helix domain-containing protein [Scytonema hofmannii]KYC42019.1 hypothetical protein WA1_18620 [Scytonema hofmannii PCC 7110]
MLVKDLMNQTEMSFDELAPILLSCRVNADNPETEVSETVAKRILSTVAKIGGQPKLPQLSGTTESQGIKQPDGKLSELVNPSGEPNKSAIKSFAEAHQITQKLVTASVDAIQQKNIRLTIEAAYLKRQKEIELLQAEQMGRAIADYQHEQFKSDELRDRVRALRASNYNVDDLMQTTFGVTFSQFSESAQKKIDATVQENQEDNLIIDLLIQGKTPEEICQILGKPQSQIQDWHFSQVSLRKNLQELCS